MSLSKEESARISAMSNEEFFCWFRRENEITLSILKDLETSLRVEHEDLQASLKLSHDKTQLLLSSTEVSSQQKDTEVPSLVKRESVFVPSSRVDLALTRREELACQQVAQSCMHIDPFHTIPPRWFGTVNGSVSDPRRRFGGYLG